jgi:SAM-dependent methyltransferase
MNAPSDTQAVSVIWHDLECGAYGADLPLWRSLAERFGDPVLDVGAGTGRIALELARLGHRVTALDHDAALVAELARRAEGLGLTAVHGDARSFTLDDRFSLIIVPMQTIQLLGGEQERGRFLRLAAQHLRDGGTVAIAITEIVECFSAEEDVGVPMPDICEIDGTVYSSQPTAVRTDGERFVLERLRETVTPSGERACERNLVRLDLVSARQLEREGAAAGLRPVGRESIDPTGDHVGSVVVMLGG